MPIDIEQFDEGSDTELHASGETNAEIIFSFPASHSDQAFTPKEIHMATDVVRGSIGVVLSRLEDRGLVRHRGDYWAISEGVDPETTLTALGTARAVTDRFGGEDPDDCGIGVDEETN
jgi:hypothetical protein